MSSTALLSLLSQGLDAELRAVAETLRARGLRTSLCSLLAEAVPSDPSDRSALELAQRMVLRGQWEDLLEMLAPLLADRAQLECAVLSQQYLETLHWLQGCHEEHPFRPPAGIRMDPEMDVARTVGLLQRLETLAPPAHFHSLCLCLQLERIALHPQLGDWSVAGGRLAVLELVATLLGQAAPASPPPADVPAPVPVLIASAAVERPVPAAKGAAVSWTIEQAPLAPPTRRIRPPGPLDMWSAEGAQTRSTPLVLLASTSPLRCVCAVSSQMDRESVALGSNARSAHLVSFSTKSARPSDPRPDGDVADLHRGSVYCMHFRAGLLATGSNDKCVRICRVGAGGIVAEGTMRGHSGTVRCVGFSEAGLLGSAGAGDMCARLWDVDTNACVRTFSPHQRTVHGMAWHGEQLLTACEEGVVTAHDPRAPSPVYSIRVQEGVCSVAAAGARLICGCVGGLVVVLDLGLRSVVSSEHLHTEDVRAIAVYPGTAEDEDFLLLTTCFDGEAKLMRGSTRLSRTALTPLARLSAHSDKVLGAAFTASGLPVTTGADGRALLWSP